MIMRRQLSFGCMKLQRNHRRWRSCLEVVIARGLLAEVQVVTDADTRHSSSLLCPEARPRGGAGGRRWGFRGKKKTSEALIATGCTQSTLALGETALSPIPVEWALKKRNSWMGSQKDQLNGLSKRTSWMRFQNRTNWMGYQKRISWISHKKMTSWMGHHKSTSYQKQQGFACHWHWGNQCCQCLHFQGHRSTLAS